MNESEQYVFFNRSFPSANTLLLRGPKPVLVDPGFGSDLPVLLKWLAANQLRPEDLALVVNTHYHSDHVGGNHALQEEHGVLIGAHRIEADLINRRDRTACAAEWLRQPVEAYSVKLSLDEGDTINTGAAVWRVLHTPGHTQGHIALFETEDGVLVSGDTAHSNDVGWINPVIEGKDSVARSIESLKRLSSLNARIAFSGHGPAIRDPAKAIALALRRLADWLKNPEGAAWHAAKRILAYALMIEGGIKRDMLEAYLAASPWISDFARAPFAMRSADFSKTIVENMLASGAIAWQGNRLVACSPHTPTNPLWPKSPTIPRLWE